MQLLCGVYDEIAAGVDKNQTMEELEARNQALYADIRPQAYETSYANPEYTLKMLGEEFGPFITLCGSASAWKDRKGLPWRFRAAYDRDGIICRDL